MAKYMINIFAGDLETRSESKNSYEFVMKKYGEWSEKIGSKTIVAHKLKDGEGRVLSLKNEVVKDGPFTESKETLGGFYLVEANGYDEAVEMAKDCPTLLYQGGYVEVREVEI